MTYTDPARSVPEAARLLRPGGLLAFSAETPLHFICWDDESGRIGRTLRTNYFEHRKSEGSDAVCFSLPYGDWIALFRRHGFVVEDLLELRPPAGARSTYTGFVDYDWAAAWPAEHIWRLRRPA